MAAGQFGVTLQATPSVLLAALLVSLMGTAVGYGLAMAIPEPRVTNLIINVIVFVVLLFSPIVIPIERFPDWAATLNRVLPCCHMGNLIRAGLTDGLAVGAGASAAVLFRCGP